MLSVRSSRVLMAWMVVEALAWVPRAGVYLAPEHHWLPPQVYSLAVVVRLIALAGVCLHTSCGSTTTRWMTPLPQRWTIPQRIWPLTSDRDLITPNPDNSAPAKGDPPFAVRPSTGFSG